MTDNANSFDTTTEKKMNNLMITPEDASTSKAYVGLRNSQVDEGMMTAFELLAAITDTKSEFPSDHNAKLDAIDKMISGEQAIIEQQIDLAQRRLRELKVGRTILDRILPED